MKGYYGVPIAKIIERTNAGEDVVREVFKELELINFETWKSCNNKEPPLNSPGYQRWHECGERVKLHVYHLGDKNTLKDVVWEEKAFSLLREKGFEVYPPPVKVKKSGRPHNVINKENRKDQRFSVIYMLDIDMIMLAQESEIDDETDSMFIEKAIDRWLEGDRVFVKKSELMGRRKQKSLTIKVSTIDALEEFCDEGHKKTAVIESAIWCEANRRKGSAL